MQAVVNQSLSLLDAVDRLVASGTPESFTPLVAKLSQALFSYCAKRSVSGEVNLWLQCQQDKGCTLALSTDDIEPEYFKQLQSLGDVAPLEDNFCPRSDFRLWTELHGTKLCLEGDEVEMATLGVTDDRGDEDYSVDEKSNSPIYTDGESEKMDSTVTTSSFTKKGVDKMKRNMKPSKLKPKSQDLSHQENEDNSLRRMSGRKRVLTAKMKEALETGMKVKTGPGKSDSKEHDVTMETRYSSPRKGYKSWGNSGEVMGTRNRRAVVVLKDIARSGGGGQPSLIRKSALELECNDDVMDSGNHGKGHRSKKRKISEWGSVEKTQGLHPEKMNVTEEECIDIPDARSNGGDAEMKSMKGRKITASAKKQIDRNTTEEEVGILVNALSSLRNSTSSCEVVALPINVVKDEPAEDEGESNVTETPDGEDVVSLVNEHATDSEGAGCTNDINNQGPKFYCIYCNKAADMIQNLSKASISFDTRALMRKHIEMKHVRERGEKIILDCPLCDFQTVTEDIDRKSMSNRMLKHVAQEHGMCYTETQLPGQEAKFYCFYCISHEAILAGDCPEDKTFESQIALSKHIQKEHAQGSSFDTYLRCSVCGYEPHSSNTNTGRAVLTMMHHMVKKHHIPISNHTVLPDVQEECLQMPPWRSRVFFCFYCYDLSRADTVLTIESEALMSRRDLSRHICGKHVSNDGKSQDLKCPTCPYSLHNNTDATRMTNMMLSHMLEAHRFVFWISSDDSKQEATTPEAITEDIIDTSVFAQEEILLEVGDSSMVSIMGEYDMAECNATDPLPCMYCESNDIGKAFTSISELHEHIASEHLSKPENDGTLDCPKCFFKLKTEGGFSIESCVDMLEHVNLTHKPTTTITVQSDATTPRHPKKRGRKPGKLGVHEYICMFCNDPVKMMFGLENIRIGVFGTQKDLFIHLRDFHCECSEGEIAFHCPMCSQQMLGQEKWLWGIMKRALNHLSSVHMLQYIRPKQKSFRSAAEIRELTDLDFSAKRHGVPSNGVSMSQTSGSDDGAVDSSAAEAVDGDIIDDVQDREDPSGESSMEPIDLNNSKEASSQSLLSGDHYFCLLCAKKQLPQVPTFNLFGELQTHVLEEHSFQSGVRTYLECVECQQQFFTQGKYHRHMAYRMLNHVQDVHNLSFRTQAGSQSDKKPSSSQIEPSATDAGANEASIEQNANESLPIVVETTVASSAAEDEMNIDSTDEEDHVDGETTLIYPCLFCQISTSSVGELRQHVLESHVNIVSPDVFSLCCPKCEWTSANSSNKDDLILSSNNFISHCILKHSLLHQSQESDVVSMLLKAAEGDSSGNVSVKTEEEEEEDAAAGTACFVCDDGHYEDFVSLCQHVQEEHIVSQGGTYILISCPVCQNTYMGPDVVPDNDRQARSFVEMLLSHMVKSHGLQVPACVPVHHCGICGYETVVEARLSSHSRTHAANQVTDTTTETVPSEIPVKNEEGFYICHECGAKFTEAFKWRRHVQRHSFQGLLCTICGRLSKKRHYLVTHSWAVHKVNISGRDLIKCPDCGEEMAWTCMSKHIKKHQGPQRAFPCGLCGVVSQGLAEYRSHKKKMHSQSGWYHCSECDFKTKNINYLPKHKVLMHDKQEKIVCSLCNSVFNNEERLKAHLVKHHPEGQMTNYCSLCSRQLSSKIAYENHMFVSHSVNISTRQVMTCPMCSFRTLGNSLLKAHMNNHRQDVFRCEICDHVSHSRAVYNTHKKRIHGNQRFQCNFCSHQSADRHTLLKHISKRHTAVSYTCEHCNYVAVTEERLKKHQKTAHNIGREEESRMLTALMSEGSEALRKGMPVQIEVVNEENPELMSTENMEEQMAVYVADEQEQADIVAHALSEMANQGGEHLQEISEHDLPVELGNADIAVQALSQMSEGGEEVVVYTSGTEAQQEEVVLQGENGEQIPYESIETVVQDGVSYYYLTLKDDQQ